MTDKPTSNLLCTGRGRTGRRKANTHGPDFPPIAEADITGAGFEAGAGAAIKLI
jgi:hypothetical protein